ncbi:hypothetical protein [Rubritalea tangerina]|uniref:hypothetical protein n=1 Tax=Rubritalea tangerina TaxID=430798 RepID=UPI00360E15DA
MYCELLFTDSGLEMVSGAQPRSAVGCSVLFCKGSFSLLCSYVGMFFPGVQVGTDQPL